MSTKTKKVDKKNVVLKFGSHEEAEAFLTYWYDSGNDAWHGAKYDYLQEDEIVVEADLAQKKIWKLI